MTAFVTIEPGQWVLAFHQPYGPYGKPMREHLEMFCQSGGGWDTHDKDDMIFVLKVDRVMPKTYTAFGATRYTGEGQRMDRGCVIAACATEDEAVALRTRFFAIGVQADDQIDFVVERLARPVRKRVYAKALKEIHACLPHIFGREA